MSELKKFSYKVYLYRFFNKLIFVFPFYVLMFQAYGLNGKQIATLLIIWKTTTFLLEYPSGVIADKYSRKAQLIGAQLLKIAMLGCWYFSKDFNFLALGFVFWGASTALISGTYQAFVYDYLKERESESKYRHIYTNAKTYEYVGILLLGVIASFLFKIGSYNLTIIASALALLLSLLPLALVKESKIHQSTDETEELAKTFSGFKLLRDNKTLIVFILIIVFIEAIGMPVDEYSTLFANKSGLAIANIGYFTSILGLFSLIGTQIGGKFKPSPDKAKLLIFIDGTILLLAAYLLNMFGILLFLFDVIIYEIFDTHYEDSIQGEVPSHIRSTVSSMISFLSRIAAILVFFAFGALYDIGGIRWGFYLLGISTVVFSLLWYAYSRIYRPKGTAAQKTSANS